MSEELAWLKAELEQVEQALATSDALPTAQREVILAALRAQRKTLQNRIAMLAGSGAIAQDHSVAAGESGVAVGRDVGGDVLAPGAHKEVHYYGTEDTDPDTLRAAAVAELQHLIAQSVRSFSSLSSLVTPQGEQVKTEILVAARNSKDALFNYFDDNRLYFPKELCNKLQRFCQVLGRTWHDYLLSQAYDHTKDYEAFMHMDRGFTAITERIPKLRQEIELELRPLMEP